MNNFRTLLLIPVLVIQMSGILTNFSWDSLQLAELSKKVCREIKNETLSKIPKSTTDYLFKREALKCENNPINRKEIPLKCEIHSKVNLKKSEYRTPAKKDSIDSQLPVKKVSVISNVLFSGTGNAELF